MSLLFSLADAARFLNVMGSPVKTSKTSAETKSPRNWLGGQLPGSETSHLLPHAAQAAASDTPAPFNGRSSMLESSGLRARQWLWKPLGAPC